MIIRKYMIAVALVLVCAGWAIGAVSQEEAKKLGTTLTPIGAVKAGNAEGSIPEYTGGLINPPAGYVKGSGLRPDPFMGEKPLFSIDAKNIAQYADKLTEGTKALMKKYPSFRIDIYKTHRTVAFPEFVAANTVKNALKAKTAREGLSLQNAHAGYPFPIPKDGYEAMWNHLTRFSGDAYTINFESYNIDSAGIPSLSLIATFIFDYPFYDTGKMKVDYFYRMKALYTGPPRRAGEAVIILEPLDYTEKGRRAWQYLPGQRRVRLAPDIAFDTPNPGTAGGSCYDDTFLFNGSMERFNFKLIGKKEIYVPYNNYKLSYFQGDMKQVLTPKHLNPDLVRWELHRVWVVEGTLAEGKRHIYSKRTYYLDEDSWTALASDEYDKRGNMYRMGLAYMSPSYDLPAPSADMQTYYDLIAHSYAVNFWPRKGIKYTNKLRDVEFSPDGLAGSGLR
ncbi:MAG: DUF1329 domain-containing protein [Deltaproteobacteria bacterium]|nr:DUF1329 domain-containing protein [Deltaproteobacteria bacterium]